MMHIRVSRGMTALVVETWDWRRPRAQPPPVAGWAWNRSNPVKGKRTLSFHWTGASRTLFKGASSLIGMGTSNVIFGKHVVLLLFF